MSYQALSESFKATWPRVAKANLLIYRKPTLIGRGEFLRYRESLALDVCSEEVLRHTIGN